MVNVLKLDSPQEKALQEVEDVLLKHNIQINHIYCGVAITIGKKTYKIVDTDTGEESADLPRSFDTERLQELKIF